MSNYDDNYLAANHPDNHPDNDGNGDWSGPVSPRESYLEAENDRLSVEVVELRAKVERQRELLRQCIKWFGMSEYRNYPLEEDVASAIAPTLDEAER